MPQIFLVLYKWVNIHPLNKHYADYFAPAIKANIFHASSLEFHAVFLQFGTVPHADRQPVFLLWTQYSMTADAILTSNVETVDIKIHDKSLQLPE